MTEIALWLLMLPDGDIVFQRRSRAAAVSAGLLGLFGGHIERGEQPDGAASRELKEETSLDPGELNRAFLASFQLIRSGKPYKYYVYAATIPDIKFEVYEGDRAEVYSRTAALRRQDLSPSTKYTLTEVWKG